MIKKVLTASVVSAMVLSISGCGSTTPVASPSPTAKISFEENINFTNLKPYTSNDTFATLAAASPYYMGIQPVEHPSIQALNTEKQTKITDAITITGELFSLEKNFQNALIPFRKGYLDFLAVTLKAEPKLKNFTKDTAKQFIQYQSTEAAQIASFESLSSTNSDPLTTAILEYQKTSIALQLSSKLYQELDFILSNSAQLNNLFQNTTNTTISNAWSTYSTQLDKLENLSTTMDSINEKIARLDFTIKQIKTVDHDIGLAAIDFIQQYSADVQAKINTIPATAELEPEQINFLKDYANLFDSFSKQLKDASAKVDTKDLITSTSSTKTETFPLAYADNTPSYLEQAQNALHATYSGGKQVAKLTWKGFKLLYGAAQTTVGVTLDTANALTHAGMNLLVDKYYQVPNSEIAQNIAQDMNQIANNFNKGISGVKVLNTAKEYLEAPEKYAQDTVTGTAEQAFGKGWTSWGIGKTAGLTVDLFTTFGKGIYKLANQNSTTGDYIQGSLDVGLSFIGGSKVILKGSQALAGSTAAAPVVAQGGLNYLRSAFNKLMKAGAAGDLEALNTFRATFGELSEAQMNRYIRATLELATRDALEQALLNSAQILKAKFAKLITDGANTVGSNLSSVGQALEDFISKGIGQSLQEYFTTDIAQYASENVIKQIGRGSGNLLKDYFDNIIGDAVENAIKDKVKAYVDGTGIPGTAPDLSALAGTWTEGEMVITNISISPEAEKEAKAQGCDVSEIKKEEGKTKTMTLSLVPNSEFGGNMVIKMSDGKAQTVPFTYNDGVISASFTQQDTTTNIHMNVTSENGVYKVTGPVEMNYKGDVIKMSGTTSASKKIPAPSVKTKTQG